MALPALNRLKKKKDFDIVFKKGKAVSGSFLFIKTIPTKLNRARFGFIVAAKFVPQAVARNQLRRLLSDTLWPELLPNMPAYDTVVVITKKIPINALVVRADFLAVLRQARLL